MNKHFVFIFLCSISFTDVIKSMEYNNYNGSELLPPHSIDTRDVIAIVNGMIASYLYVKIGTGCAMNHCQAFLEKPKKTKPFPKKALIKHLKQQNSTQFNSRKNCFHRFGKR